MACLVSRYEDMVADPAGEVDQIARYLGIRLRRDECQDVASQYTVARQLGRIRESRGAPADSSTAMAFATIPAPISMSTTSARARAESGVSSREPKWR